MQYKIVIIIFASANIFDSTLSAPSDSKQLASHQSSEHEDDIVTTEISTGRSAHNLWPHSQSSGRRRDYYEFRNVVAGGVQQALDECREKFKWHRWNCPKKAFHDILDRNSLPSNKELGLARALIASGIVISLTRSCSYGTKPNLCGCSSNSGFLAYRASLSRLAMEQKLDQTVILDIVQRAEFYKHLETDRSVIAAKEAKFIWRGCDQDVQFGFRVSKVYLEPPGRERDESSRRIDAHNYEVGRLAVKRNMRRLCKCHGISGSCQVNTCWTTVPDMNKVGDYLKHKYRRAMKVGAMSAEETEVSSLKKELTTIKPDNLVFANASPDYCYEYPSLGINGTLGRYCSKARHRADGSEVSTAERDSCDSLCTKCGYKVKREVLSIEKQCDCRFVYCCSIECTRCPHAEDTYKCAKHG